MKEKLYTIPLTDAFNAKDECPFCFIERKLEQDALEYALGSSASYMQSDTREQTDKLGFCRDHYKKMYQYGNTLGNALILQTRLKKFNADFEKACKQYSPTAKKLFSKNVTEKNSLVSFLETEKSTCFICDHIESTFDRYIATFFYLLKKEPTFFDLVKESKGFCMDHLGRLVADAPNYLSVNEQEKYIPSILDLSIENMHRMQEEVDWLVDKFDYRNADADWKNSRDALPRGISKIAGGYPTDKPYKQKK